MQFTKDELMEIKRCLKYMINGGITPFSCLTLDIKKKIQSMIDNYCEHDGEIGKDYPAEKCMKCGAYWE